MPIHCTACRAIDPGDAPKTKQIRIQSTAVGAHLLAAEDSFPFFLCFSRRTDLESRASDDIEDVRVRAATSSALTIWWAPIDQG